MKTAIVFGSILVMLVMIGKGLPERNLAQKSKNVAMEISSDEKDLEKKKIIRYSCIKII